MSGAASPIPHTYRATPTCLRSELGGRFALTSTRSDRRLPLRHPRTGRPGRGSRRRLLHAQVNGFCAAHAVETDRIIAVEVLTPAGNWSSYPPHKHDEACRARSPRWRRSTTSSSAPKVAATHPTGSGFNGCTAPHSARSMSLSKSAPATSCLCRTAGMAIDGRPGYDLYYLNDGGPSAERTWLIRDDPQHAWVRETWRDQSPDPRVPLVQPRGDRVNAIRLTVAQAVVGSSRSSTPSATESSAGSSRAASASSGTAMSPGSVRRCCSKSSTIQQRFATSRPQ